MTRFTRTRLFVSTLVFATCEECRVVLPRRRCAGRARGRCAAGRRQAPGSRRDRPPPPAARRPPMVTPNVEGVPRLDGVAALGRQELDAAPPAARRLQDRLAGRGALPRSLTAWTLGALSAFHAMALLPANQAAEAPAPSRAAAEASPSSPGLPPRREPAPASPCICHKPRGRPRPCGEGSS